MLYEVDDATRPTTRRAIIKKVDDSKSQQRVDVEGLKGEKPKKLWRPQEFGSTSVPPKDSDGIMEQMGSRSDRTLYYDAGHQKYRPKNTPEGCKAIFNMHGDIIRVFKDSSDLVHREKINIRIGKGYDAGNSDSPPNGQIDDKSDEDTQTISIVLDGSKIRLEAEGNSVEMDLDEGTVTATAVNRFAGGVEGGKWVVAKSGRVDLGVAGPDAEASNRVMTDAGPSTIVWAVI